MAPPEMTEFHPALLAQHDGWLRALIRRLVDGDAADDVVQEVWQQAWRRPPFDPRSWPKWLATVARRTAGRARRATVRRDRRERAVAKAGAEAVADVDPALLAARAEERQRVARAVLELDDPFRTVVLLRYFEALEPAAIARRLGVPAATVRTRLHRAHEQLRARFERERGAGWRAQFAVLWPVLGAQPVRWSAPVAVAAIALLPLLAAVALWWNGSGVVGLRADGTTLAAGAVAAAADERSDGAASPDPREIVAPAAAAAAPAPPAPEPVRIAGRVFDPHGRPLAGVPIEAGEQRLGTSDAGGAFEVTTAASGDARDLRAGDGWCTVLAWSPDAFTVKPADDALIVAVPLVHVGGRVVDEAGTPLEGRRVECSLSGAVPFPLPAAGTVDQGRGSWSATTDASGRFAIDGAPGTEYALLTADSLAPQAMPERNTDDVVLVLVLEKRVPKPRPARAPEAPSLRAVAGTVRANDGQPIAGARVLVVGSAGGGATTTDETGAYCVQPWLPDGPAWPRVVAVAAAGWEAASQELRAAAADGTAHLDFALAPALRAIVGRVVDAAGHGRNGIVVALADPTPFEASSATSACIERLAPHPFGPHATSADDGAFRIEGVLARDYRLRLLDPASGTVLTTPPVSPDRAVEICFDLAPRRPFRLRVVDATRHPVADVQVEVRAIARRSVSAGGGSTRFLDGDWRARTATNGGASFASLPGGELLVRLRCPGFVCTDVDLPAGPESSCDCVLLRQCSLRVEVADFADRYEAGMGLCLFDADGHQLPLQPAWRGARMPNAWSFGIARGRSSVAGVAETAVRAELHARDGTVLRTMLLALDPDIVNVLTFPAR